MKERVSQSHVACARINRESNQLVKVEKLTAGDIRIKGSDIWRNHILKKTEVITKTAPLPRVEADERKPVLLGQTRSIKIVDLHIRKRRRNPANCKYCNNLIESRYALSKGSRTGARYYHIECAIKVGFDITV